MLSFKASNDDVVHRCPYQPMRYESKQGVWTLTPHWRSLGACLEEKFLHLEDSSPSKLPGSRQ